VLRSQERTLGPENWFELLHRNEKRRLAEAWKRFSGHLPRLPTITRIEAGSKGQNQRAGWCQDGNLRAVR
jgi:hypothetical protein